MYRILPDPTTFEQVAALPVGCLASYAELLDVLEIAPWDGLPQHEDNPDGALRRRTFGPLGAGHVVYLVLEEPREVHIVLVQWLG